MGNAAGQTFEKLLEEALAAPFAGWDFSFLRGRRILEDAPWDYEQVAGRRVAASTAVLDLGTGGGEVLCELRPFPRMAVATESYPPNVKLAAATLRPCGVRVVHADDSTQSTLAPETDRDNHRRRLPFRDGVFDLVLARNTAYAPAEAFRLLRPGGWLVSQNGLPLRPGRKELSDHLGGPGPDWGTWGFLGPARQAGFDIIDYQEAEPATRYRDIGAVVYCLLHIPWIVTDFSLERYEARLRRIHEQILRDGELVIHGHACFLQARRPA